MPEFNTPNPSAGVARILKPAPDFEDTFQGLAARLGASTPAQIPFFEWPQGKQPSSLRAPSAGKPGFDPDLVNVITVPYGSVMQMAIPALTRIEDAVTFPVTYRYTIAWRWASIEAYNAQNNGRYSVGTEGLGAPDGGDSRVTLLAATQSLEFIQAEVVDASGIVNVVAQQYDIVGPPGTVGRPFLAPGTQGVLMQGIVDSSFPFANGAPYMLTKPFFCAADELLLVVERRPAVESEPEDWDFTDPDGTDFQFSNIFGRGGVVPSHENYGTAGIYLWPISSGAGP